MKNLYSIGIPTTFVFCIFFIGTSFSVNESARPQSDSEIPVSAFVVNNSHSVIYYKPESRKDNPGLDPNGAYPIAPGETLYAPVDAIVTSATTAGKVYRVPTGGKVIVNEKGIPEPANIIARGGALLPAYGMVKPPCVQFDKLANSNQEPSNLTVISHLHS